MFKQFPMFKSVRQIADRLSVYDVQANNNFFKEEEKIKELRASGPPRQLVMSICEPEGAIPESAVFSRGDPLSPKEPVEPGELFVLARDREIPPVPIDRDALPTTGRRFAYTRN